MLKVGKRGEVVVVSELFGLNGTKACVKFER